MLERAYKLRLKIINEFFIISKNYKLKLLLLYFYFRNFLINFLLNF